MVRRNNRLSQAVRQARGHGVAAISNLGSQISGVLAVHRIRDAHFGTAGFIGLKAARAMKRPSLLMPFRLTPARPAVPALKA
jgi:hypothetical protein